MGSIAVTKDDFLKAINSRNIKKLRELEDLFRDSFYGNVLFYQAKYRKEECPICIEDLITDMPYWIANPVQNKGADICLSMAPPRSNADDFAWLSKIDKESEEQRPCIYFGEKPLEIFYNKRDEEMVFELCGLLQLISTPGEKLTPYLRMAIEDQEETMVFCLLQAGAKVDVIIDSEETVMGSMPMTLSDVVSKCDNVKIKMMFEIIHGRETGTMSSKEELKLKNRNKAWDDGAFRVEGYCVNRINAMEYRTVPDDECDDEERDIPDMASDDELGPWTNWPDQC